LTGVRRTKRGKVNINIILADDHPVVLLGAKSSLIDRRYDNLKVVATANSPDQLLERLARTPCEVLITDFAMPKGDSADGLAMIGRVRRQYPQVNVVVLSTLTSAHTLRAMLRQGVLGLYDKRATLDDLPRAARLAAAGRRYISPAYQQLLEQPNDPLSPRELEVLRMLASGLSGRDIARLTHRSEKTVSRQKRTAMEKLGLVHDSALLDYVNGRKATG
jgi:two-component system capsular synthesis response regulator RcsB